MKLEFLMGIGFLYRCSFSKGTIFLVDTATLDSISNGGVVGSAYLRLVLRG